jgi:Nucleotidyl transferase AbiEii toxin, Type IV TA system
LGRGVIPEPQRTYVLELLKALGPLAEDFVIAGAQAMKFVVKQARATKDIDFVLDAVKLRGEHVPIAKKLQELGYQVVEGARNFQFQKSIPGSTEVMRIEFMAPEELKRDKDFRVEVAEGIHARALTGGSIALAETAYHKLSGRLPDGSPFTANMRVTQSHALVMLKLLALDERYRNIRGPRESVHDREEARTHAADVIAIVTSQSDRGTFRQAFDKQFRGDQLLGRRVSELLSSYFRESTSPGYLVYEEQLLAGRPTDQATRREVREEIERAREMMVDVFGVSKVVS